MNGDPISVLLVGGGTHAKTVFEFIRQNGWSVATVADPEPCDWIDAPTLDDKDAMASADLRTTCSGGQAVIGLGGTSPKAMSRRYDLQKEFEANGWHFPQLVAKNAYVSDDATIGAGAIIGASAHVGPYATIGEGALVNTAAIVEHDATIGDGAHVCPRATVLGAGNVGKCSLIGSGAVVLPGATVESDSIVPALTVHGQRA